MRSLSLSLSTIYCIHLSTFTTVLHLITWFKCYFFRFSLSNFFQAFVMVKPWKTNCFHGVMLIDTKSCFDYCFTSCPETQKCRIQFIHISIFVAFFFKAISFAHLPRFLVIKRMSCSTMVHQDQF